MRRITPLLLAAFLAAPVRAEFQLSAQSLDVFRSELDSAVSSLEAAQAEAAAGKTPKTDEVRSAFESVAGRLEAMGGAFNESEKRGPAFARIADYAAAVQALLPKLASEAKPEDVASAAAEALPPLRGGRAALYEFLGKRVADLSGPKREGEKGDKTAVAGATADLSRVDALHGKGLDAGGSLNSVYDNSLARASGLTSPTAGVVPGEAAKGPALGLSVLDFKPKGRGGLDKAPDAIETISAGDDKKPEPEPSEGSRLKRSLTEAFANLPIVPEGLSKQAKQALFGGYDAEMKRALGEAEAELARAPAMLRAEADLKAKIARALEKGGSEEEQTRLLGELQDFYGDHPELAAYHRARAGREEFLRRSLRDGSIPDGRTFSPADFGMDRPGTLVKRTMDGKEGLLYEPPPGSGANKMFESADGRMIREFSAGKDGTEAVATRYLREDGRPEREVIQAGGKVSEIGYVYGEDGVLLGQKITEYAQGQATSIKEVAFDPRTGRPSGIRERDGTGKILVTTTLRADGKVEVHDHVKRIVQYGETDKNGKVRVTRAVVAGTEHDALIDEKGNVAGVQLRPDLKTGRPDLSGLVKAGYLTEGQAGQFLRAFPDAAVRNGGMEHFSIPPRLQFGADGPMFLFESANGKTKSQVTYYYDKRAGGWVDSFHLTMADGETSDVVKIHRAWNAREARFNEVEEYRTVWVTRYEALRGYFTDKDTAFTKMRWNAGAKKWDTVESKTPENAGLWDMVTKNIGWTFGNVPVYKQVGQGIGFVAGTGKFVGYTITGGTGELIGSVTGSTDHSAYGIVSKYQAMDFLDGMGGVMMSELRADLPKDDFELRRGYWVERYREAMLKSPGLTPHQKVALTHGDFQVNDDELGKFVISGGAGEGFGGAGREFAKRSVESRTTAGKIGWGIASANVYAADFTFQSLGFNGLGTAFGALGKTADAFDKAGKTGILARTVQAANYGAKGAQLTQNAYFNSMMAMQGLELGSAVSQGDSERITNSLAQIAALGVIPRGGEKKPGEALGRGLNPKRMASEFFGTSMMANMTRSALRLASPSPRPSGTPPPAAEGRMLALAKKLGYNPDASSFKLWLGPQAPPAVPNPEQGKLGESRPLKDAKTRTSESGAEAKGRLELSLADRLFTSKGQQEKAQLLWEAVHRANSMNEKPIEVQYFKAPRPGDAYRLYWTHLRQGGMKGHAPATNLAAATIGAVARTPVEGVKMNAQGEILGTTASGHSNVAGFLFAAGGRLAKSNKPAHEIGHALQYTLLAGAQQKGLITGREALLIQNMQTAAGKVAGYSWGGRGEKAVESVEFGGSVQTVFRNMRKNALEHFNKTSPTPAIAKARYREFRQHINGVERVLRAEYPDLFVLPGASQ